ncbi:MAG: hypothetical protein ATN31_07685 [Candidatus Epulonipiscioides saccharophilum]|nr:MAG: hypothetical protein ATN31_07685 [Epulopiscium sp. AS2M-Bin001]
MLTEQKLRKIYIRHGENTFQDEYIFKSIIEDLLSKAPEYNLLMLSIQHQIPVLVMTQVSGIGDLESVQNIIEHLLKSEDWTEKTAKVAVDYFIYAKFEQKIYSFVDVKKSKNISCIKTSLAIILACVAIYGCKVLIDIGTTTIHNMISSVKEFKAEDKKEINLSNTEQALSNTLTAFEQYAAQAVLGDKVAQYSLGIYYYYGSEYGYGITQNYSEALRWFRAAADQDYADAQVSLGQCYYYGHGVERDLSQAKYWIELAVNQNHAEAISFMKIIDRTLVLENGSADEQFALAMLLYNDDNNDGLTQNYKEAVLFFASAAAKNHKEAQQKLGDCYFYGHGLPQDIDLASQWYAAAKESTTP